MANASFSICAYRHSISVIACDANAISRHTLSSLCNSTAPNLNKEASAEILVSATGL